MQSLELLTYPVLQVKIGDTDTEGRPLAFHLITTTGIPHSIARLDFPLVSKDGQVGDAVSVSLMTDDVSELLFTGEVSSASVHIDKRELYLSDGYRKLMSTPYTAAYRKESAKTILQDILDAAGIKESAITCPAVTLARFSTAETNAALCIDILIRALEEHGESGLCYFFDAKNVFHFGTINDTGKNEGETVAFEAGKNIIELAGSWIVVLPTVSIRHGQKITIDGKEFIAIRTDLCVSASRTRLVIFYAEAD